MHKTKINSVIFVIIIALILPAFSGCRKNTTWTVAVYMCGSDLETQTDAAGKNIDEMLKADIPSNVNVVIQTGGAAKWRSHNISSEKLSRYTVKNGALTLEETQPDASMGSPDTLSDFLNYVRKNYPADKTMLILWDHGGGSLKGLASDENHGNDTLTLPEFSKALDASEKSGGKSYGIIGFDACLMANYETVKTAAPYGEMMVASEEIIPSGGWDYKGMLDLISKNPEISYKKLSENVCDLYMKKCEISDKQSTSALSVIDLSSADSLVSAFDAMAADMKKKEKNFSGIKEIASGANTAGKCGGDTDGEGYSNMIDLGNFAVNVKNVKHARNLADIIKKAVVYQVRGDEESYDSGMSFYYPIHPVSADIDRYCSEIAPDTNYSAYLSYVYNNIPKNTVIFSDPGTAVNDENNTGNQAFKITLDSSCADMILNVKYQVVEMNDYILKKNTKELRYTWLGSDNDMYTTDDGLTFTSNFRGIWVSLNGVKLYTTALEKNKDHNSYSAAVRVNNKKTNLRYIWKPSDGETGQGDYIITGFWNGINSQTGMSSRDITPVKDSDTVKALRQSMIMDYYPQENRLSVYEHMRDTVPVPVNISGDAYRISESPLSEKYYAYQYVVTDIFGIEHYSAIAIFKMMYTEDELNKKPLADGSSAAKISDIWYDAGSIYSAAVYVLGDGMKTPELTITE